MKYLILTGAIWILVACNINREDREAVGRTLAARAESHGYRLLSFRIDRKIDSSRQFNLYFVSEKIDSAHQIHNRTDTLVLYKTSDNILLIPYGSGDGK